MFRAFLLFSVATLGMLPVAAATDPYCPVYAPAERAQLAAEKARVEAFHQFSRSRPGKLKAALVLADSGNLVDQYIFGKMQADSVNPAPASSVIAADGSANRSSSLGGTGLVRPSRVSRKPTRYVLTDPG